MLYAPTAAPASNSTTSIVPVTVQPSQPAYTFNANASDNVAVYYGASLNTTTGGLLALCQSTDVDIINLAFLFSFFGPRGYPSINFGPGCSGPNIVQSAEAPGLSDCSALASEIDSCQQIGKKVLVSLGGYNSNTSFTSDDQATGFASTLWNLFGAGACLLPLHERALSQHSSTDYRQATARIRLSDRSDQT